MNINVKYEAIPVYDEKWMGQVTIDGKVRLCNHKHTTADLADSCAGTLARRMVRDSW